MFIKSLLLVVLVISNQSVSSEEELPKDNNIKIDEKIEPIKLTDEPQKIINSTTKVEKGKDESESVKIFVNKSQSDNNQKLFNGLLVIFAVGIIAIGYIGYRAYRLRFSRAERKYGVQGQSGTQESTPLHLEDDDSDNDQTLFDIKQSKFIRENFVA